ncbi:MAG: hypothetical protein APR55_04175 [Methanolinea sp. SDB]|nr:MAG: hypothetical protein APR55_04175 [Methanolinea sp. SDB]
MDNRKTPAIALVFLFMLLPSIRSFHGIYLINYNFLIRNKAYRFESRSKWDDNGQQRGVWTI